MSSKESFENKYEDYAESNTFLSSSQNEKDGLRSRDVESDYLFLTTTCSPLSLSQFNHRPLAIVRWLCRSIFGENEDDLSQEIDSLVKNHLSEDEVQSDTEDKFVDEAVEISQEFLSKLKYFMEIKLKILETRLEKDIYCNGTVYTGSAGLALYYLKCYFQDSNCDFLKIAMKYINLDNLKGKRISFLCGDAGPLAIAGVISYKLSKKQDGILEYESIVARLLSLMSLLDDSPNELLYGRAGYLFALLFVKKHITEENVIPTKHFEKVINSILQSGKTFAKKMNSESPLLWQWHEKIYYGAAHGMAGILYLLLQAREYIDAVEINNSIKPTLDWLLSLQFPSKNFPSSHESTSGDRLVQWCHGAPGFVPLCLLAYEIFGNKKYLKVALQSGDVVWERGLCKKGYSICHGVSGNAYAFIQLYQTTQKPLHLYRAACFMEWCLGEHKGTEYHRPDRPASLFEGLVGRVYLAREFVDIQNARFPAFTV